MTKGELLRRIDSAELTEWIAYYRIEAQEMEEARRRAKSGAPSPPKPVTLSG